MGHALYNVAEKERKKCTCSVDYADGCVSNNVRLAAAAAAAAATSYIRHPLLLRCCFGCVYSFKLSPARKELKRLQISRIEWVNGYPARNTPLQLKWRQIELPSHAVFNSQVRSCSVLVK